MGGEGACVMSKVLLGRVRCGCSCSQGHDELAEALEAVTGLEEVQVCFCMACPGPVPL